MVAHTIDGFEHGLTASGTAGPYEQTAGAPAIDATTFRTGARSLRIATAVAEYLGRTFVAGTRRVTASFYIRLETLPTALVNLGVFLGTTNNIFGFDNASGTFTVGVNSNNAATRQNVGPTVVADTWYLVDIDVDTSTGTASMKGKIDGGTEATSSFAQAAADLTAFRMGTGAADTIDAYYDDVALAISTAAATDPAYPIGTHTVEHLIPTADGTHSISGANEIERTATGTDIVNGTTDAYLLIDDVPMDTTPTDYINDVGTNAASYVEVTFGNLAGGTDVPVDVFVRQIDRDSTGTGTSAAVSRILLSDSTAVTPDIRLSSDDPGTTVTMRKKALDRPSGGWDRTKVDGLKARLGLGDGAPDVWFGSLILEVLLTPAPASTPAFPFHRTDPRLIRNR